jgi:hypothetical protein
MLLAQKQVRDMAGPSRRVWEVFSNWFRQSKPFFGRSGGLVDENPQSEFVAAGVTGDVDALTSFTEQVIGRAVAVCTSASSADDSGADVCSLERGPHRKRTPQHTMHLERSNDSSLSSG